MSHRTIASRARRAVCVAVPVVVAVLAFAQAASAAGTTYPSTVLTPGAVGQSGATNGSQLAADVAGLTTAGGFNLIQLCACDYVLPAGTGGNLAIPANVQVEITGPPLATGSPTGNQEVVDGTNLATNIITTAAGDNVILKGFNLTNAPAGFSAVQTNGGNVELDNMSLWNQFGNGLTVAGGTVAVNDSQVGDNVNSASFNGEGITQTGGVLTLHHTTVSGDSKYGIQGTDYFMYDSLLINNVGNNCNPASNGSSPPPGLQNTDMNTYDNDGSCFDNADPGLSVQAPAAYLGGPTKSAPITSTGTAGSLTADNITSCPVEDERFFLSPSTSSCNPGAAQNGATRVTSEPGNYSTTTPSISCTVKTTTETPPASQVVAVTDPTAWLGPDTILNATTTNGTISWPVSGSTLFDETNAAGTNPQNWVTAPTASEYDITAFKPSTDATVGDTSWSFTAMDWLGNTKLCK
jgi:hypothetical protein